VSLRLSPRSVPLILGLCGLPAVAQELPVLPVPATASLTPAAHRLGYAFDRPQILLRQRLFGLAHGASLLASACLERADQTAQTAATAYEQWRTGQEATINRLSGDLARWYFGSRASEAGWSDVARAIGLRDQLDPHSETELADACTSLPAALTNSRYDLATLIKLDGQIVVSPRAVAPSIDPTHD
jgi:hypothetical protein